MIFFANFFERNFRQLQVKPILSQVYAVNFKENRRPRVAKARPRPLARHSELNRSKAELKCCRRRGVDFPPSCFGFFDST